MIDLHLHSRCSDGSDEPAALVRACRAAGLTIISLTDHDTTAGWDAAAAAAQAEGLEFIPGIEITAVLGDRDVHMLGYFPSRHVPLLEQFLATQRADRVRRVREIVDRLASMGFPVDLDAVLQHASSKPERTIGRPRIADAMIARGYVANRDEAFAKYLGYGCPAFVERRGATPEEVVELIIASGGLPSLAHPGLLDRDEIIPALVIAGLPAIEVFHTDHDADTSARYHRLATRSRLLVTGGSDFHGAAAGHHDVALGRITLPRDDYDAFRARLFA